MAGKRGLIHGVGINDADYNVYRREVVDGKSKIVWICPFYDKWKSMITRCYSEVFQLKFPSYIGCVTVPEWHYFMTFRAWMVEQDWESKQLDKDVLLQGNKLYGPETCVFVDANVNTFLNDSAKARGLYPVGVCLHKMTGKFQANCHEVNSDKIKYLGLYETAENAYDAWLRFKNEQAKILADKQPDERVKQALLRRYKI